MLVGRARAEAARWVLEHTRQAASFTFRGAFFSGSSIWLPDNVELPPASDVDVLVVVAEDEPPPKLGKVPHRGVLVEVTYLPMRRVAGAEQVLADAHLAGSFRDRRVDPIVADPTGHLRHLHERVAAGFADPAWVRRRYEHIRRRIDQGLRSLDPTAPFHDQVTSWLFPTSMTALIPLITTCRNPTVRRRYLAARQALADDGLGDRYPDLLELLGCSRLTGERAERHLAELALTFDAAAEVARTPFPFSRDVTAAARPVAIDGSRLLVESGDHREAVFWMVATFARCHKILAADAPALERARRPAFTAMVADLGITSTDDLLRRVDRVRRFLPRLWETAEELMAAEGRPSSSG